MKRRLLQRLGRRRAALACCVCGVLALPGGLTAARQDQVQSARIRESNRREGWQRVPDILVALGVEPGARVADVGAGDGFFTIRLARAVGGQGRVLAVDIDRGALDRLRARVTEEGLTNVDVIESAADDPRLPAGSLDGVLIVNAYHEMAAFPSMLAHVGQALKPGGRLVLVEPLDPALRAEPREKQTAHHSLDAGFAERELRAAGFDIIALRDPFLDTGSGEQWLMVATPSRARPAAGAAHGAGEPQRQAVPSSPNDAGTESELAADELRISAEELKTLLEGSRVLVLDVRGADSYVAGHLPGAVLMPFGDLAERAGTLSGETRAIITYCD